MKDKLVVKRAKRLTRLEKIKASKVLGRNLAGKSDTEIRRLLAEAKKKQR